MSENNWQNIDGEENTTPAEETTEEVVEEVETEEVEDTEAQEVADEIIDVTEILDDEEPVVDSVQEVKVKGNAGKVVAIVVVIVAILAAAGFGVIKYLTRNPYNAMGYINVSGRTIEDVATSAGQSLEQFLADYGLPADMPADTEEAAAFYNIPVYKIAEMYGMDMAALKEMLGLGDDVTDSTPWGEAEGKSPLSKYIGEENLESFKAEYGLGDEVTGDTLWGEVRNTVDMKNLEAQKEAETQAEDEAETDTDATVDDAEEEASAE